MTQYQYKRPPTTAVESAPPLTARDNNTLENRVKNLSNRVDQQTKDLQEVQRAVRRLQNEVRAAVNAFNLKHHG